MFPHFTHKQFFTRIALNIVIFVILTTASSNASVNQVDTVSESETQLFFYDDRIYPRDCKEVQDHCSTRNSTGAHFILPDGYQEPFWVFCSGEWTVFQRRFGGYIEYNRTWADYRDGFGFLRIDHWLGNERLSYITNQKVYELRIELETDSGVRGTISYEGFRINDEFSDYSLVSIGPRIGMEDSEIIQCPTNMVYGNCIACIPTCADPSGTEDCSSDCTEYPMTCVCQPNYLMNGSDCVPEEQCGCHVHGYGVVTDGTTHVAANCSEYTCYSGVLTRDLSPCAREAACRENGCSCNEGHVGDGRTCTRGIRQDCSDLPSERASGNYNTTSGWILNCNMTIDGGGWTVIQRHYLSSSRQDFEQNWAAYKSGFGSSTGEFWIGNEKLFNLTNQKEYELRIDMVNRDQDSYHAKYDFFRISSESSNYQLSGLGSFSGTADHDGLRTPRSSPQTCNRENMYFSTPDRDNDRDPRYNSAAYCLSSWWYNHHCGCYNDLNFGNDHSNSYVGFWHYLPGDDHLIYTEMKIRPKEANQ